ncbi:hypothetical protein GCM10017674_81430 [Streptomyces gardneri]|uniref:Uncharacterized protein n=1 Tax=Streptomyces gardneri TaxID=66892 RepID=A0A4Y3R9L5_9ACTN|nr:hypothetical protein SGA01_00010 [Streptomyces gardneri]GHH24187.1 hypothetical protein GCM10017674_81430 [Streptomyces gardneri]
MSDEYMLVERMPPEALVQRHEGRPAEQERMVRTHRARVVECRCDDEPSQTMTSHVGCDGHSADAHHLRLGGTDRDRQP